MKFNGNLLKAELVLRGINLTELAKKLDLTKATVSKKMNGRSEWTLSEIQTIGDMLGKERLNDIFLL